MLTRIDIVNFRRLSQVKLEAGPATVLVGPNSCGKTTALHAVQLACQALSFGAARGKVGVDKDGWLTLIGKQPLRDDQSFLPTSKWIELFSDADPEREIEITLHFSQEHAIQQVVVKLYAGRAEALRLTVRVQATDGGLLRQVIDGAAGKRQAFGRKVKTLGGAPEEAGILRTLRDHLPRAVFIPAFYGVVRDEQYLARGAVEALLQSGQQGQVVRNLLMRLPSLVGINEFLPRAGLSARLARCTSLQETDTVRYLEVLFRDSNGELELSSAGTGLASLLALYAAIQLYQTQKGGGPVVFMLDEPEAHLHPRLQGEVADSLVEMITTAGNQLLCATHSVEMINRFGRNRRATVLRMDSQASFATEPKGVVRVLRSEDDLLDDLSAWCDLSPFASLNLLSTRRVLFYEGPTDFDILSACARLYLGSDPERLARFQLFAPVKLSGTGNLAAKEILKTALLPLTRQLPLGERFRVVRVLDRDYARSTQFELREDPASRYEELSVVWSKHSIEALFLNPECLASWLDAALSSPTRPPDLTRTRLTELCRLAIAAADQNPDLNQYAIAQLTPKIAQTRTDVGISSAIQEATRLVQNEPGTYQRGHNRCREVLRHVRQALLDAPATRDLAKLVRRDIAQIVQNSPLQANLLLPPGLIPDEIKTLLDHLARPGP